ncbi:unnamed protein product [Heligmosomoides polygyrus]|uniref:Reverse transcriptase domain-containing protein n=1 Tax=Heligmosomoides polygyrus TaxID=6339 RepID=A0A183GI63_HELPZ|nr:unnamed protein product [Heligmosomoides polygyrus]
MKIYKRLVDSRLRAFSAFCLAFLDLEKACDRLPRTLLWKAFRGRVVPERLTTVIKDMYEGSKAAIRTPHWVTRKVDITVGVLQGSALDPFLFLLTLDSMVNHLEEGPLRRILYADDVALVADKQEELEEKVQLWQRDNGLRLNVKKAKFISSEKCAGSILYGQGEAIKEMKEFRSLGSDPSEEIFDYFFPRFRSTRKASERSHKEKVEARHHAVKVYTEVDGEEPFHEIQAAINFIEKWATTWELPWAAEKPHCLVTQTKHQHNSPPYKLKDTDLIHVENARDLCFHISSDLSFNSHYKAIVKKANYRIYNLWSRQGQTA